MLHDSRFIQNARQAMTHRTFVLRSRIFLVGIVLVLLFSSTLAALVVGATDSRNQGTQPAPNAPQLLWGSNLTLKDDKDSFLNDATVQSLAQKIHVQLMRVPYRSLDLAIKAAQQIKALGMAPLILLKYGEQATDLQIVDAMNTIFGGSTVYYEYGNEEELSGTKSDAYTASWNAIIPAVKQHAPNGYFIGPVISHADAKYIGTFLTGANPRPDAVSWHEYTCDSQATTGECLAAIDNWANHFKDARDAMTRAINTPLPIWITEYNWNANPTDNPNMMQDSLFMSSWTTKAFQSFITNGIAAANQYVLSDNPLLAMITPKHQITGQASAFQTTYEQNASPCQTPQTCKEDCPSPTPTPSPTTTPTVTPTPTTTPTPDPTAPMLVIAPTDQLLTASTFPGNAAASLVTLTNGGGGPLTWTATVQVQSGANWLSVNGSGSSIEAGKSMAMEVDITTQGLQPGDYPGQIQIMSNGGNATIFVHLTVLSGGAASTTITPSPAATSSPITYGPASLSTEPTSITQPLCTPTPTPGCSGPQSTSTSPFGTPSPTSTPTSGKKSRSKGTPTPSPTSTPTSASGCPGLTPTPTATSGPQPSIGQAYDHVFLIVLENHNISVLNQAPYLNQLAQSGLVAQQFYAEGTSSEPNYLALVAGSTFGVRDNNPHVINAQNLADQLEQKGLTWKAYIEDLPQAGFLGNSSKNGLYARKHNPWVSFSDITANPARLQKVVPFTQFTQDVQTGTLPNFLWITPNLCNDMHTGPGCSSIQQATAAGNQFLQTQVGLITSSTVWKNSRSILIITFDEGTDSQGCCGSSTGGGHIPFIALDSKQSLHGQLSTPSNHYGLLRWIEQIWGLDCLAESCNTPPMALPTP